MRRRSASADFCHCHLHTDRSFLDGVGRSSEYVELAVRAGHRAIAITDHGNMYGLPEHRRACREAGIKPIFGCEVYVADRRGDNDPRAPLAAGEHRDPTYSDNHLVLLCENEAGWRNLLRINHESVVNGFHRKPRTTHAIVCQHADGLIATTACLGSQFARLALRGEHARLRAMFKQFKAAFGDRFYAEVHVNEIEDQQRVNAILAQEARTLGVPLLLTCDVHYACLEDAARQDEMIAVTRRTRIDDPNAFKLEARHLWYSGPQDIRAYAARFGSGLDPGELDAAIRNTVALAERCNADIYPAGGKLRPPVYADPDGSGLPPDKLLRRFTSSGLAEKVRAGAVPRERLDEYRRRAEHELKVIARCGMADFYLVTMDLVRFCRARGITCWTRGSGCGSLVAALCGITPIDPLRFGLLFERFVDPERAAAPDFDLDIDSRRRHEVVDYMVERYGGANGERVARISALMTFGLRAAIRDVGFAHGLAPSDAFRLADVVDAISPATEDQLAACAVADRATTIAEAKKEIDSVATPQQRAILAKAPGGMLDAALLMVGRVRGKTQHAAGFIVAPEPLENLVPVDRAKGKDSEIVTAWGEGQAAQDLAETGLMKIDLLALDTCAVVGQCEEATGQAFDPWAADYADPRVLREFASGDGMGLHQLSQQDQQLARVLRRMSPKSVDDVIAAIALYRPGSMAYLDEFIARAAGRKSVPAVHPVFDEITRDTYGILVYQEQIMLLLHRLGAIPLRAAYDVIKAISKKRTDKIGAAREQFMRGATGKGVPQAVAERLFADVMKFAGYGFNKSHAASYGVLSWVTARQRALFPLQFWHAWLSRTENASRKDGDRKVYLIMSAAQRSGVRLLSPRVDASNDQWRAVKVRGRDALLAPLSLVLGVGSAAARSVFEARSRWISAPSHPLLGKLPAFLRWAESNRRVVNTAAVGAIAKAGAFSCLGVSVATAVDAVKFWAACKPGKSSGSRLEQLIEVTDSDRGGIYVSKDDPGTYPIWERLAIGFDFWRTPWAVGNKSDVVARMEGKGLIEKAESRAANGRRRAFLVSIVRLHRDKRGRRMAFLTLRTRAGSTVRGVCFSSAFARAESSLRPGEIVLLAGDYDQKGDYLVSSSHRAPAVPVDSDAVSRMLARAQ